MLCSAFLREMKPTGHGLFYRALERVFQGMLNTYSISLRWVLGHRPVMLAMFLAVLGTTAYMYVAVPKGFHPGHRQRQLQTCRPRAAQGTSFYQMVKYQQLVSQIIVRDPDVESFYSSTGGGFGGSANTGRLMINLKPRRQRRGHRRRCRQPVAPATLELSGIARVHLGSPGHPRGRAYVQKQF